ncbi:hypothetical protein EDD11_001186 [Mortierella claussenii]|nr:hypothetical protein EDD11_001186 [Mortierella claussenii]
MEYADIRVFAKQLQSPGLIHQVCVGDWARPRNTTRDTSPESPDQLDVVFGRGSSLSLYKFLVDKTDVEERPRGSFELVHTQPLFGMIKDIKTVRCRFDPEDEHDMDMETDVEDQPDRPRYRYLPKTASPIVLAVTSDSGLLSFLTFEYDGGEGGVLGTGKFYSLLQVRIAYPGADYQQVGAKLAVDPTHRVMAVSALYGRIKVIRMKSTKRSLFNPVERISEFGVKGTIIAIDFLTTSDDDRDTVVILAVLFFSKETSRHHIGTFHINLDMDDLTGTPGTLSMQLGNSQLASDPLQSVVIMKALPNIPRAMIYVDELGEETARGSLSEAYPLISACTAPPPSPYPMSDQTLYLGSDTSELYRVKIKYRTLAMHFELVSSERPVGSTMQVLARREFITESLLTEPSQELLLNIDYLVYSSDYGDGGVVAFKEEEDGIDVYAVASLQNSSPVVDFCAQEPLLPGRDSLFLCSGMKEEGALKRVRSGISVTSSGSSGSELFAGATGLWSLKENSSDAFESILVVSFIQSTKLMRSIGGDSLEEIGEDCGIDISQATVHAGRLVDGYIFQVHRSGVVAANLANGTRFSWNSEHGILTTACLIKDGALALGQISSGVSSLLVLEFIKREFRVVSSRFLQAESTAIHCWTSDLGTTDQMDGIGDQGDVLCAVGTLEPAVLVFQISENDIRDVCSRTLTQTSRDSLAIPHSICFLRSNKGRGKIAVGLRDGCIVTYDWKVLQDPPFALSFKASGPMTSSRMYRIGVLPVKFASSRSSAHSNTLILSDKLWMASFENEFDIQPVLFRSEVSLACPFKCGEDGPLAQADYVFIVDHNDLEFVALEGAGKYQHQTLTLGRTPRKILDISSKGLLLVATVGDGFPYAESTVHLIDPDRASDETEPEKQQILADFRLKRGEAKGDYKSRKFDLELRWAMSMPAPVFAMSAFTDMKLLISNGPVLKLLALDLEKKTMVEKASYRERWPITQISTFDNMICTGSKRESICFYVYQVGTGGERTHDKLRFLKSSRVARMVTDCIALSSNFAIGADMSGSIFGVGYSADDPSCQHTLLDRFSFNMGEIVNRIRLANVWSAGERSLKGIPLSEYGDGMQHTNASILDSISNGNNNSNSDNGGGGGVPLQQPLPEQILSWIFLPWQTPDTAESSSSFPIPTPAIQPQLSTHTAGYRVHDSSLAEVTPAPSLSQLCPQALIACTLPGSIYGFWRLNPAAYSLLGILQSALETAYECCSVLKSARHRVHDLSPKDYHSNMPGHGPVAKLHQAQQQNSINGTLIISFLRLDHSLQTEALFGAFGLDKALQDWIQSTGMNPEERAYFEAPPCSEAMSQCGEALMMPTGTGTAQASQHGSEPLLQPTHMCPDHRHLERDLVRFELESNAQEKMEEHSDVIQQRIQLQIEQVCRTATTLNRILPALQSLDWHQI